jgi:hypothetical protein
LLFHRSSQPGCIAQDLSVTDAQRLDPALLSESERDKEAELDEFFSRKVPMQLFPLLSLAGTKYHSRHRELILLSRACHSM